MKNDLKKRRKIFPIPQKEKQVSGQEKEGEWKKSPSEKKEGERQTCGETKAPWGRQKKQKENCEAQAQEEKKKRSGQKKKEKKTSNSGNGPTQLNSGYFEEVWITSDQQTRGISWASDLIKIAGEILEEYKKKVKKKKTISSPFHSTLNNNNITSSFVCRPNEASLCFSGVSSERQHCCCCWGHLAAQSPWHRQRECVIASPQEDFSPQALSPPLITPAATSLKTTKKVETLESEGEENYPMKRRNEEGEMEEKKKKRKGEGVEAKQDQEEKNTMNETTQDFSHFFARSSSLASINGEGGEEKRNDAPGGGGGGGAPAGDIEECFPKQTLDSVEDQLVKWCEENQLFYFQ